MNILLASAQTKLVENGSSFACILMFIRCGTNEQHCSVIKAAEANPNNSKHAGSRTEHRRHVLRKPGVGKETCVGEDGASW